MTSPDPTTQRRKGRRATPPAERFWPKVDVRGPDDCWPWTAGTSGGYGSFRIREGVTVTAHSYAKELDTGVACPDDLEAQHTCKTPASQVCCNPSHVVYARPGSLAATRRGMDAYGCKLTDDQVREIRRRAAAGEVHTALAREFGVSQPHVSNIVNRNSRAYVI